MGNNTKTHNANIKVEISWCVEDVRHILKDEVKDMSYNDIYIRLGRMSKWFEMAYNEIGRDIISDHFLLKGKE